MNNINMYNKHLQRYVNHYTECYVKWQKRSIAANDYDTELNKQFLKEARNSRPVIRSGRKFDKIIFRNSVMAFVAKANGIHKGIQYKLGDVFKSATRSQPAKHVRGSIFMDSYDEWNTWTGPGYMHQLKGGK